VGYSKNTNIRKRWGVHDPLSSYGGAAPASNYCKHKTLKYSYINLIQLQEKSVAEKINRKLRQQMEEYRVPDVMDYVREKATLQDLHKQNKIWERKVDIAEVWISGGGVTPYVEGGVYWVILWWMLNGY